MQENLNMVYDYLYKIIKYIVYYMIFNLHTDFIKLIFITKKIKRK